MLRNKVIKSVTFHLEIKTATVCSENGTLLQQLSTADGDSVSSNKVILKKLLSQPLRALNYFSYIFKENEMRVDSLMFRLTT